MYSLDPTDTESLGQESGRYLKNIYNIDKNLWSSFYSNNVGVYKREPYDSLSLLATINKRRPKWLTSIMIFLVFTRENLMIAGLYMVTINMRRPKCLTSIMIFLVFTRENLMIAFFKWSQQYA